MAVFAPVVLAALLLEDHDLAAAAVGQNLRGDRGALHPGRNRSPSRVDHHPRSEAEVLGRDPGGAPRPIRTKRGVPTIRVAIREANALFAFSRQGKDAIRAFMEHME